MTEDDSYSEIADQQLDELEAGTDADLYNAVLQTCQFVFDESAKAQRYSAAITTLEGVRFRLPVVGFPPYKVFWSSDGPRIEAVFPHP